MRYDYELCQPSCVDRMEQERRSVPRFQFIAPVEVVEESSGALTNSYLSDLALNGCLVGMSDPPREGAEVRLKVITPTEHFEAGGTVVHAQPHHVGVAFRNVPPQSLAVLRSWIATAKFPKGGRL